MFRAMAPTYQGVVYAVEVARDAAVRRGITINGMPFASQAQQLR